MPSRGSAVSGPGLREDIQGLRAVAVIAVVANHVVGWPAGGFVGVDVFFVISGFLITSLLLREYDSQGRISLADFYRRRARRILPAATVCLVLVVAAAAVMYRTARFDAIAGDAVSSMLFVANWHFAVVGSDYVSSAGPISPLQHFWSLAVEEQFYLLLPILLVFVGRVVCRRGRRSAKPMLAVALIAMLAGSFGWAVLETANSPTWAYFSTLSRGWEIAVGALLAVGAGRLPALSTGLRTSMSIGGLALIAAALVAIGPASAVPGPWSVVPVLGALLVLAAGIGGEPRWSWMLTNAGAGYVGRISYSLYLWHFPVIVLAAALLPVGVMGMVATVVVLVAISIASFHLVEEPFRHVSRDGVAIRAPRYRPRILAGGAAVIVSAVVIAAVVTIGGPEPAARAYADPTGLTSVDPAAKLSGELEVALLAGEWPVLTPAIDGIAETGRPPKDRECAVGLGDPEAQQGAESTASEGGSAARSPVRGSAAACAFGDSDAIGLAVVVGDSMAISWIPLVQQVLAPRGYRIQGLTMSGCPFVGTETRNPAANISAFCPTHKAAVVEMISALQPDVVFISNTYDPWLPGRPAADIAANRYAQGQLSVIEEFAAATGAVYVLAPPPPGRSLSECATAISAPVDCVSGIPEGWREFNSAMSVRLAGASKVTYVDTGSWFCTGDGRCPSFVGNTPVRRDAAGHVIPAYAQRLAPLLAAILGPQRR